MRHLKTLIFTAAAVGACLGLAACGGTAHKAKSTATAKAAAQSPQDTTVATAPVGSAASRKVVASVGSEPITLAMVEHLMTIANAPVPLPDPPAYTGCIARMKTEAGRAAEATPQTEAQLKVACRKRYEELLKGALSSAIHSKWLIGEAAEQGVTVSTREIQREFDQSRKSAFRTNAEFEAYRKGTRETIADLKKELELSKLTDKLIHKANEAALPASAAEVTAFYNSHRAQFTIPTGRTVRIVRTATQGAAIRAKQQLQAGKSFASIAKELATIAQPTETKDGEVADLKPGVYEEKKLNDAIFSAQLNRLYGPLELTATHKTIAGEPNTGFFVFEVKKIVPGGLIPLAKVRHTIAEGLTKSRQSNAFTSYVRKFREKWIARTDCRPGYVVNNCKQFKSSNALQAAELHAL